MIMKYISFIVPCYNSQDYMRRCVDSLLADREHTEIIIVDDGSSDNTAAIAEEYALEFPGCVRAVHQQNKGHGGAVNTGLELAEGVYVKVVDSDDWLDGEALFKLLEKLKEYSEGGSRQAAPDLIVTNYCYNHLDSGRSREMHYRNVFPENTLCRWEDTGSFRPSQYLVMHALIYRREVLDKAELTLPEHCFYVDNIFASQPLTWVKTVCYLDLDLYQYFLGREDQSVNEHVMIRRIDQQIRVTRMVADQAGTAQVLLAPKKLKKYLYRNVSIMLAISDIHLLLEGSREALQKRREMWGYVQRRDAGLYRFLRYRTLGGMTYLPGLPGRYLTLSGYRLARKIFQFQ